MKNCLGERKYKAIPPGELTQAQVKALASKGGFVWEGRANGSWQGHFPPWPRTSKSWFLYGQRQAATCVLRYLWDCWQEQHDLTRADVPIPNLYSEVIAEPGV